jgi:histidinol dehydrogenase
MIPVYSWNSLEIAGYLQRIDARRSEPNAEVEAQVSGIIAEVRRQGDMALLRFTREFDKVDLKSLRIAPEEVQVLANQVDAELREVIRLAKENIRRFHTHQMERSWEFEASDGVRLGQRISPLPSVGLYVPGGTAAYPSTVLMNAIPAQIAGVPQIVVTTPYHQIQRNPVIAAVFLELGILEIYGVGGAQAIAALAYGTESVPRVSKIVGPGNIYVATAKRQVFGAVDIDMIAGPSEVIVVADDFVDPDFIAADLMAQAEHDENACAIAIVTSKEMALAVQISLASLIKNLSRQKVVRTALQSFGALIVCPNWDEAAEAVNRIAPEHLELLMEQPENFADRVQAAGAIFFGPYSCEAVGDYFAGPNHVLPTSGTARFASPLGVYDFLKKTSLVKYTEAGLRRNRTYIEKFAASENLDAHALSVRVRFKN